MAETYRGILYVSPAVPHIHVDLGRKWFGLRRRLERWLPAFSPDIELPLAIREAQATAATHKGFAMFEIEFEGCPSESGTFGPKGFCSRQVTVQRIVGVGRGETLMASNPILRKLSGLDE